MDHIPTVLLVEDEPLVRMATAMMLEDAGYQVLEAENADTALAMLRAHGDIATVVTDVQMPGQLDGLALTETITREFPHIRTVVTSGRTGAMEALRSGAAAFLPKPYTADAIYGALRRKH